ncbi:MAG: LysR family transcriptional regulator [Myxococcaceae bacterium]|jgi:DNA-binding transcriptional LysR family regulator|nr:LysR family transcriptional regulator [Myxococcaceae bacterium]
MRDWNEVAVFEAVVRQGGFTAAAQALGLQKSTVSRMVARLEERLGVRLLERTSRQVSVTPAGRAYVERCAEGLRLLEAAEGDVEPLDEPVGTVRLTAVPDFAQRFLGPLVGEFSKASPRVHVELVLTTRIVDLIDERVDLAIRSGPLPDSSLVARRVGTARRFLVASPGYLAAHGRPRSVDDLSRHACLGYRATEGVVAWRLFTRKGPKTVRVKARLSADDFEVLQAWARDGLGIAMLPGFVCEAAIEAGALVPVLERALDDEVPLFLVHPSGRHLPARVRVLRDFLVERLAHAGARNH